MWWVACLVRGMPVDEAVKQLCYVKRKGAGYVKQVILEAQALAVRDHNVEFKSNLWVGKSSFDRNCTYYSITKASSLKN